MKTITLNLPEPLYAKIMDEVARMGFAGKSDFLRFLALNYFLQKKSIPEIEDSEIAGLEKGIVKTLGLYLKDTKNIAQVIHIEK